MPLYHRITRIVMNGAAASADVAWFDTDPEDDPLAVPFRIDGIPLDAANIGAVTPEVLADAIQQYEDAIVRNRAASVPPRPEVAAMLGHGRVMRGGRSERTRPAKDGR